MTNDKKNEPNLNKEQVKQLLTEAVTELVEVSEASKEIGSSISLGSDGLVSRYENLIDDLELVASEHILDDRISYLCNDYRETLHDFNHLVMQAASLAALSGVIEDRLTLIKNYLGSIDAMLLSERGSKEPFEDSLPSAILLQDNESGYWKTMSLDEFIVLSIIEKAKLIQKKDVWILNQKGEKVPPAVSYSLLNKIALDADLGEEILRTSPHDEPFAIWIFVVDDDPMVRKFLCNRLSRAFPYFKFKEFNDGESCLEVLPHFTKQNKCNPFLLVDYELEGMNGIEFLRKVRSSPKLRDIPAIMVTGKTEREIRDQLEGLNCLGCVNKKSVVNDITVLLKYLESMAKANKSTI